jgi:hypothetical protein
MKVIKLPCFDIVINIMANKHAGGIASSELGREYEQILDLILAHAVAGVDVESLAYIEGIETAVQSAGNRM